MFDLVVVAVIALAAFAGWKRGFIAPLFAVSLSLVGLYAIYAGPGAGMVPTGAAGVGLGVLLVGIASSFLLRIGSAIVSVVHRVGILQKADHVLGMPMGVATGLVTVYLALIAVVSFDAIIAPLHGKATVDQAAVAAIRAAVAANPQFAVMIDPGTLDTLAKQVAKTALPADQLSKVDQMLALYETNVRPALLASAIAPFLLGVGEHAPVLGRHVDFPQK
ncbi:MAG: hypothetical protein M3R54_05235 [Chloroflexota bacterium]|nr:hypothetical protein [Chloroflexota bacterium]